MAGSPNGVMIDLHDSIGCGPFSQARHSRLDHDAGDDQRQNGGGVLAGSGPEVAAILWDGTDQRGEVFVGASSCLKWGTLSEMTGILGHLPHGIIVNEEFTRVGIDGDGADFPDNAA